MAVARSALFTDAWRGALWVDDLEVWACDHLHRNQNAAMKCAERNGRDVLRSDTTRYHWQQERMEELT